MTNEFLQFLNKDKIIYLFDRRFSQTLSQTHLRVHLTRQAANRAYHIVSSLLRLLWKTVTYLANVTFLRIHFNLLPIDEFFTQCFVVIKFVVAFSQFFHTVWIHFFTNNFNRLSNNEFFTQCFRSDRIRRYVFPIFYNVWIYVLRFILTVFQLTNFSFYANDEFLFFMNIESVRIDELSRVFTSSRKNVISIFLIVSFTFVMFSVYRKRNAQSN